MEHIAQNLSLFTDFKGTSNRAYILSLIKKQLDSKIGEVYKDKNGKIKKVKEVNPRYLAVRLAHVKPDSALMDYHLKCMKARIPYSRALFGNIKVRT